jgi:hypothetical protein
MYAFHLHAQADIHSHFYCGVYHSCVSLLDDRPTPLQVVNVGNCLRLEQATAPHCHWRTLAAFNNRGTAVKLMQLERVAMAGAHEL